MPTTVLNNAEIADRLSALAQMLTLEKANPYKIRAYRRAAAVIRGMGESVDELVRSGADLTEFSGIGAAIAAAIAEIVQTGSLKSLEKLRAQSSPELVEISAHPRLDPKRVLRIYKKLGIASIEQLRHALENGKVEKVFGVRMAQHVRQGLIPSQAILLYHAHAIRVAIEDFLEKKCAVTKVEAVGDYRRRVETIDRLEFLIEADDFKKVVSCFERFGGRTPLVEQAADSAVFALPSGPLLELRNTQSKKWGLALIRSTGSKAHLRKLARVTGSLAELERKNSFVGEDEFYRAFRMQFIPPELREGLDETQQAREGTLPRLVTRKDMRGDLHTHTEASDGADTLKDMVIAARELGYEYVGITDHSQSLKIAQGLSTERLRQQIRAIDKLNERVDGIRILKSAEVDILADGSLDYPDDLLKELDYTVCSIHSRFSMGKEAQTERILRAMDNRYFNILGHATGRLLLKRPGYEIDFERVLEHAKQNGCFFELNSSPDRLDVSAENARMAKAAGVMIAISTDSHSTPEYETIYFGIEQARRAGLEKSSVLNCQPWKTVEKLFAR